jgi:hypothetical protein
LTEGDLRFFSGPDTDLEVVYVALAGPPSSVAESGCYDNSGLRSTDWEYFGLVATAVEKTVCIDKNQELVFGQRAGGALATMLGCYFSAVDPNRAFGPNVTLRGQLTVVPSVAVALPACAGPVAAMWLHDPAEFAPIEDSRASLKRVLFQNGCADDTTVDFGTGTLAGKGCKQYVSCPAEYPVIFCETPNAGRQSNYYTLVAPAEKQFAAEIAAP